MPSKESSQDTKQAISCLQTLLAIIAVIVGAIAIGFLVTSLDFQHAENGLWILFGIGLVFFMLVSVVIKRKQKKSQDLTSKQIDIPKNDFILPNTALGHPQSDKVEKNYCESSNKLQALPSVEGHEITEKKKWKKEFQSKVFPLLLCILSIHSGWNVHVLTGKNPALQNHWITLAEFVNI